MGSTATVTDSLISGGNTGITAGDLSKLTLNRSVVTSGTTGRGLQLANGSVSATASTIRGGDNGVLFVPSGSVGTPGRLVLDSTLVQGQNGAAIVVNDFGLAPVSATIEVNNGSTLVGGNGRILQVDGVSATVKKPRVTTTPTLSVPPWSSAGISNWPTTILSSRTPNCRA